MPVILATQEAEIRRIVVQRQPRQIVCETLPWKNPSQKKAGGVAQGVDPEFKPQYRRKKKKKRNRKQTDFIYYKTTYKIVGPGASGSCP
jgi:hypothetical protein